MSTAHPKKSFARLVVAVAFAAGLAIFSARLYRADHPRAALAVRAQASGEARSSRARATPASDATNVGGVSRRSPPSPSSSGAAPLRAPASTGRESEISGVVLDASGGTIAGAQIRARAASESELALTSISADGGEFRLRLPAGSWQLTVEAEGYARTQRQLYSPTADARLVLSPASSIAGRVVSGTDRLPVAGVTVTASKSDAPPYSLLSGVSDETGAFELRPLPAGRHYLLAQSPRFLGERVSVDLAATEAVSALELEVTSATTVRGEIRAGGAGCADGTLELSGPASLRSVADAAGRLELQGVLPGSYELTVTCPSALPSRERLIVGSSPIHRSWDLESGRVIRGSVETAAGRPLAGAVVHWTRREAAPRDGVGPDRPALESSCVSDVHGDFACSGLEPGQYDGALHVQGRPQSAAPLLSVPGSGELARLRLRADASATIRVHVDGETNAPGAALAVFACDRRGAPVLAERAGAGFLLEGLALGAYGVQLGTPECTGALAASVELERDGQIADVTLALPRLARVRGRLVDPAGVPVPDAWVRASSAEPAWAVLLDGAPPVLTDAEGEFSVSGLLPGRYEVFAQATSDTGAARQTVELAPGAELELRLVLERRVPSESLLSPLERPAINHTK